MNYIREFHPMEYDPANYTIIQNNEDGNCLFESIAHYYNWCETTTESAKQIRRMISQYYDEVLPFYSHTDHTKIQNLLVELVEFETANSVSRHQDKIKYDGIYGSVCDLIAAAILFKFHFNLYMKMSDGTYMLYTIRLLDEMVNNTPLEFLYSGCDIYHAVYTFVKNKHLKTNT